eukprot:TRINITY_DN2478_c2_g6_i1.p1 TRINITY_DN2478_c2_g6~~TRINITY_DN2478_c2_g6_i1.p1  ORF type:complete len:308 (-),score=78.67 TRINITY_DN2478_c2_g6_i1:95-1018(-)
MRNSDDNITHDAVPAADAAGKTPTQALRNKQKRKDAEAKLQARRNQKRLEEQSKGEEVARMEAEFWAKERAKAAKASPAKPAPAAAPAECDHSAADPEYLRHRQANPGPIMGGIANKVPRVLFAEAVARSDPEGLVPWPIRKGCAWLIEHGLHEEGIFRIPGSNRTLRTWIDKMNEDPCFDLGPPDKEFKCSTVASLIVKFLMGQDKDWTLGHHPEEIREQCKEVGKQFKHGNFDHKKLMCKVHDILYGLPKPVLATLKTIAHMMSMIAKNEEENKMSPAKLALCMGQACGPFAEILFEEYDALFCK